MFLLKTGAEALLDALHQVMPVCQQETRQAGAGILALFALPSLDPDRIGAFPILWLAVIVPVPDQASLRLTGGAIVRSWAVSLLFLVAILLRIGSKFGYNGVG